MFKIFLGETFDDTVSPVYYSTHAGIENNQPPGTAITGMSGAGKTFLLNYINAMNTYAQATCRLIDCKNDLSRIFNLTELTNIKLIKVNDPSQHGMLDPFRVELTTGYYNISKKRWVSLEPSEIIANRVELVTATVTFLMQNLDQEQRTFVSALANDTINEYGEEASMSHLISKMRFSKKASSGASLISTGEDLERMSKRSASKALFADPDTPLPPRSKTGDGMTEIYSLMGLDFSNSDPSSVDSRIARAVFFITANQLKELMLREATTRPQIIVIDEAWAILGNPEGRKLIATIGRLARSRNTALILGTQRYADLKGKGGEEDVLSYMSQHIALRPGIDDVKDTAEALNVPHVEVARLAQAVDVKGAAIFKD